ncbi:hypothetical protein CS0771_44460 [Catellatospora sp. IY07-71]|uniref:S8 family peptidase n=1 Tax=Catellatospora sp. IY07-71 TaxID=2728827 RepID=UPI001BB2FEAB|nr:S8 family serine peptidase [Catellatospora sp. IY07-71]BCJ74902.1 hypothetical protein CS0771_44460 [Catellatospora sp. IY07-71]
MAEKVVSVNKHGFSVKNTHGLPFRPVSAFVPAPRRTPASRAPDLRRPVVAVLDTGVDPAHPWFQGDPGDPVLLDAYDEGWPRPAIADYGPHHGTFVAGVVRQHAPDAIILSVTLDRGKDGRIADRQILKALTHLYDQQHRLIDVICLAIGFRSLNAADECYKEEVRAAVDRLAERGTILVAAAGNYGTPEPVYPAAFASKAALVASVGAVTVKGHLADFSRDEDWVTRHCVGVDVFSATPLASGGALSTLDDMAVHDDNEQTALTGFGVGSGTSYAAAAYAGMLAQALLDQSGVAPFDTSTPRERAERVLNALTTPDPHRAGNGEAA